VDGSIPHTVHGHFGAGRVTLVPAGPGTGIIAGAAVRAVCEAAGIHNILTKSVGTNNPITLVKATFDALQQLRTRQDIERLRGVSLQ
jgi:small subunit ribosomal protein S5